MERKIYYDDLSMQQVAEQKVHANLSETTANMLRMEKIFISKKMLETKPNHISTMSCVATSCMDTASY